MIVADEEVSVAANGRNDNVLDNTDLERAPYDGVLTVWETGSATGLRSTIKVGQSTYRDRGRVNAQNRTPLATDDLIATDIPVPKGETVRVIIDNTTAGALTYRLRAMLERGMRV